MVHPIDSNDQNLTSMRPRGGPTRAGDVATLRRQLELATTRKGAAPVLMSAEPAFGPPPERGSGTLEVAVLGHLYVSDELDKTRSGPGFVTSFGLIPRDA